MDLATLMWLKRMKKEGGGNEEAPLVKEISEEENGINKWVSQDDAVLPYDWGEGDYSVQTPYAIANGAFSHAEGYNTIANGVNSHAEGNHTTANGVNSHAEGYLTIADGLHSHAEGNNTRTNEIGSHAEGSDTRANSIFSHAEGYNTVANGTFSHTEGNYATTNGHCSHAEGNYTVANGTFSHTEGYNTIANGQASHAEGNITIANSNFSHAEGYHTIAYGISSHAEGNNTIANGAFSHTEGYNTTTSGDYSHAEGVTTVAVQIGSHAEGYNTIANDAFSHAEGYDTIANGRYQHVSGKYNIEDTQNKYAEIIGNGESTNNRSNARTLDWNGNEWLAGDLTVNINNTEHTIASLLQRIAALEENWKGFSEPWFFVQMFASGEGLRLTSETITKLDTGVTIFDVANTGIKYSSDANNNPRTECLFGIVFQLTEYQNEPAASIGVYSPNESGIPVLFIYDNNTYMITKIYNVMSWPYILIWDKNASESEN